MNDKIIFWLSRVLEEKTSDIKKLSNRISILNYQINNFQKMQEFYKKKVIEDLLEDLEIYKDKSDLNWQYSIKEINKLLKNIK